MGRYLAILLLAGCAAVAVEPVIEPKKTDSERLAELLATPESSWPETGWLPEYSEVINIVAKEVVLPKMPCGNTELFWRSVAKAESGFKRTTVYREPMGMDSIGLLQLSVNDQKNYRLDCGFSSPREVMHPIKNLNCGVRMLAYLHQKRPTENLWQAAGRYWSVTRRATEWPTKRQSGFLRLKKYFIENQPCGEI